MASILLLNGPNLDLLGRREPAHYGATTLAAIEQHLAGLASRAGHRLVAFQSNTESALIERLHAAMDEPIDFVLINPAGLTHTSVALRDALAATGLPFIEIHLSNIHAREAFRRHSYFSDLAIGVICGLGAEGYALALQAAIRRLDPAADPAAP